MRFILVAITLILSCSPVSHHEPYAVPYCSLINSVWYIVGDRNNLNEFVFYRDSVIIWEYFYSPYKQEKGGITLEPYEVTSIIKRKLEILDTNTPYKDGDGYTILLNYYRGYTVNDIGAKIYDWSTYNYIFTCGVFQDSMWLGMYDEFKDVQVYWTFYREPQIKLNFSKWR